MQVWSVSARSMFLMAAGMGLAARLPIQLAPVEVGLLVLAAALAARWSFGRAALAVLLGASYCAAYVAFVAPAELPTAFEGERIRISARVLEVERAPPGAGRLVQRVTVGPVQFEAAGHRTTGRLLLGAYEPTSLKVGETWTLTVRLRRPRGLMNWGGFDYTSWALAERIVATGSIVDVASARRTVSSGGGRGVRESLRGFFARHVEPGDGHVLLVALALGDRGAMDAPLRALLRDTGTSHLFVVSGLHVGIVLAAALGLMAVVGVVLPIRAAIAAMFVCGYAVVVGMGLPVQRALASALLVLGALMVARQLSLPRLFAAAVLAVCCLNPLATLLASFWMSFGAVCVLLVSWSAVAVKPRDALEPAGIREGAADPDQSTGEAATWSSIQRFCRTRARAAFDWVALLGRVQIVLGIALAPISLAGIGQWTPAALPANLLAVPLVTLIAVPLVLVTNLLALVAEPLAAPMAAALADMLGMLVVGLENLAEGQPRLLQPHLAGPGAASFWISGSVGALLATLPLPRAWRVVALVLLLPVIAGRYDAPVTETLRIEVLDVGQGLSVLLRTADRALLYDAGPRFASGFDAGMAVVAPNLARTGVARLDAVVISHADVDHAGGVDAVKRTLPVLATYGPGDCAARSWRWGEVSFELGTGRGPSRNDRSCVLLVDTGLQRVLLPGDIERDAELDLLQRVDVSADVLLAPHHGSGTSSSVPFLNRVQPRLAIVSAGYRNRFGHPHPTVLARYARRGALVLATAESGAIRIFLKGRELITEPAVSRLRRPRLPSPNCLNQRPSSCRTVHGARATGARSP